VLPCGSAQESCPTCRYASDVGTRASLRIRGAATRATRISESATSAQRSCPVANGSVCASNAVGRAASWRTRIVCLYASNANGLVDPPQRSALGRCGPEQGPAASGSTQWPARSAYPPRSGLSGACLNGVAGLPVGWHATRREGGPGL
jgi:hypothetical protein